MNSTETISTLSSKVNIANRISTSINTMHSISKKRFLVPANCFHCERSMLMKKGIKCQSCKKSFHKECFQEQLKDDFCETFMPVEIFWQGYLAYTTGTGRKVFIRYWQLSKTTIFIYETSELKKKLYEIPLKKIKLFFNHEMAKTVHRNSNLSDLSCQFHFQTTKYSFNCGVKVNNRKDAIELNHSAKQFYEIFELVYLPYCQNGGNSLKIEAPKFDKRRLSEDYILDYDQLIGTGAFGKVYRGLNKITNQDMAIKVISEDHVKSKHTKTALYQIEIAILCNLEHPGIVKMFNLFYENNNVFIVMERLKLNLIDFILSKNPHRLSEGVTKFISYQVLVALEFMHHRQIAHCDLKPDNILLVDDSDNPQVKLCDFGHSKVISSDSFRKTKTGTKEYNPPEVNENRVYNRKVDVWAMGVIIYACLTGEYPFNKGYSVRKQIKSEELFVSSKFKQTSQDAIDLIKKLLQITIGLRPKISETLKHKWFCEDDELFMNLYNLEEQVGIKWLTNTKQIRKPAILASDCSNHI